MSTYSIAFTQSSHDRLIVPLIRHNKEFEDTEKPQQDESKYKTDGANDDEEAQNKEAGPEAESQPDKVPVEDAQEDTAVEPKPKDFRTLLDKGFVYFFIRGREGIDNPEKPDDVVRSYMILRPIPDEAPLRDGPVADDGIANSRLISLPMRFFPRAGTERFRGVVFVERANATFAALRDELLTADRDTETAGIRHSPAAIPIGEGMYTLTTTGRYCQLFYALLQPGKKPVVRVEKLGEVQKKMGLEKRHIWVSLTRHPQFNFKKPCLPKEAPEFSQEILDKFGSAHFIGTRPKHLVPNTQICLVGTRDWVNEALLAGKKDEKAKEEEELIEEMEKLHMEDEDMEGME